MLEALDQNEFATLSRIEAQQATRVQLKRVHTPTLIDYLFAQAPQQDYVRLDPDTVMSTHSLAAALHAAGAVTMAVDAVMSGQVRRAFCAVRPPGHHATHDTAMGFCLFNNIAVGAAHALATHKLERVAIVDFDVHHGNGTQAIFWNEPRVLYASSHQWPLYPGTGTREETGSNHIVNALLSPGAGSAEFHRAYEETLLPALDFFAPQLLLISAGFDAHRLDPLANLNLETEDYAWVTQRLVEIAERHAQGRIISSLEGGYNLTALRQSCAAHVQALLC